MVTSKVIALTASGALVVSAAGAAVALNGSTESAVTSEAALAANLDCELIADDIRDAIDSGKLTGGSAQAQATIFVAAPQSDAVEMQVAPVATTIDGRVTLADLRDSSFSATTPNGETVTLNESSLGDVTVTGGPHVDLRDPATIICGDIDTALGLVHVTATPLELATLGKRPLDAQVTDPANDLQEDLDESNQTDPEPELAPDVEAEAEAEVKVDQDGAEADAEAQTDGDS